MVWKFPNWNLGSDQNQFLAKDKIGISNRFHRQNQIKQSGNGIDFYTKNHIVLENPKIYNTWIYTNGTTNLYNGFIYADYYQYWGLYLFGFNQCEIC